MYEEYFGLKQSPFKITPDTSLFYPGGNRGAILKALVYAVMHGEGIIKVVGEVGSGKTMLSWMLESELQGKVDIVYLANPSLSPENILHAIAFELDLPIQADSSRFKVMNQLQHYLLERHAAGHQVVIFVEEAQGMPLATLEEMRLLSNLETQQYKLLQIVLFGQPELDRMIARPEIRQLKERITYSFFLTPFKFNDVKDYLNSRLRACGHHSGEVFTKAAIKAISRYSKGLIRRINILADKSMLAAYASNQHQVSARHVKQAAIDSEFIAPEQSLPLKPVLALCLLMAVVVVGYWGLELNRAAEPSVLTDKDSGINQDVQQGVEAATSPGVKDTQLTPTGGQARLLGISELIEGVVKGAADDTPQDSGIIKPNTTGDAELEGGQEDSVMSMEKGEQMGLIQNTLNGYSGNMEQRILKKQLEILPPEVAYQEAPATAESQCGFCWSIIYRPLINPENL